MMGVVLAIWARTPTSWLKKYILLTTCASYFNSGVCKLFHGALMDWLAGTYLQRFISNFTHSCGVLDCNWLATSQPGQRICQLFSLGVFALELFLPFVAVTGILKTYMRPLFVATALAFHVGIYLMTGWDF